MTFIMTIIMIIIIVMMISSSSIVVKLYLSQGQMQKSSDAVHHSVTV